MENGRRRFVTVAELVMFAKALNTSPVALVYSGEPDGYDLSVEVSPGSNQTQIDAAQWFSGLLETHYATRGDAESADEYDQNLKRLRTWREFWELDRRREALFQRLWDARAGKIELPEAERTEIVDAIGNLERRAQELVAGDGW
jgi:hypothetical protein